MSFPWAEKEARKESASIYCYVVWPYAIRNFSVSINHYISFLVCSIILFHVKEEAKVQGCHTEGHTVQGWQSKNLKELCSVPCLPQVQSFHALHNVKLSQFEIFVRCDITVFLMVSVSHCLLSIMKLNH